MLIGGFQRVSLIDYPGKISSAIFTQGCNFRCIYCHNPELVWPHLFRKVLDEKVVFDFLDRRRRQIEAVVISGGEPTIQPNLVKFIRRIRRQGFLVKLDTNGSNPKVLREILAEKLVDYIAMDIKAPPEKYNILAGTKVNLRVICESIEIIKNSKIDYEFRTTLVRSFLNERDILKIKRLIGHREKHRLQEFILKREKLMV
jgi:pyruvate formate lyase activating enzyme